MQFEDLSDNAKAAIEQYRNCKGKIGYIGVIPSLFIDCLILNNVPKNEMNDVCKLALKKNCWMENK